ncbi:ribosome biogenesis GTPase Der [Candidatus Saccharibacteria bacterium]|nr:ribosome biogenesis GTPase Der [Candidatus Saccharibacteria bacterium]MCL1963257.1 ribosome biogenesis GTPase Der [Candidatus Saccharibacteria bacterium]
MSNKLPTVAIVGRANAGKSSLFNRMVNEKRAIVAREAGTTRDNVVGKVSTDSGEFLLVDTAGLKLAEDEFEMSIQNQIADAIDAASVILLIADRTEYPDDELKSIAKKALKSQKPVFLILNKTDLKNALPREEFLRLGIRDIFETSAEHNDGVEQVIYKLTEILPKSTETDDPNTIKVSLIGRPNVGKSHLFNTLAGKQQAIVAPIAGTTRDINRVKIRFEGKTIELLDTAGVRRPGKIEQGIEKFSVLRSISAIEESDICLLLMDVNELNTGLDQKLAGQIADAGKGLILVVSKWDAVIGKDAYTRDALAPQIAATFDFVPWSPLIFTSSVTGQNVTKIFELVKQIDIERHREIKTRELNDTLQKSIMRHPPAGLKNSHPKFRYVVQTDTAPPWFVIYGSHFKFIHWSYKRYLERQFRDAFGFTGTPIKFSFRDEKQIKANRQE